MKIFLISLLVDDQEKALAFYTGMLGFQKKADITSGDYRWLSVTSPDGIAGVELSLEPATNPAARAYQQSMLEQGIPLVMFATDDLDADYARLLAKGVTFRQPPAQLGPAKVAQCYDTCGNLIQISEFTKG